MKKFLFFMLVVSSLAHAKVDPAKNNVLLQNIEKNNISSFSKNISSADKEIILVAIEYSLVMEDSRFLKALLTNPKSAKVLKENLQLAALPVQESKKALLELLVAQYPTVLTTTLENKKTLLHEAVSSASIEIIKYLAEKEKSLLQAVDENNESVLFSAARRGDRDIAIYLVDLKIDKSLKNKKGQTASDVALAEGFPKTAAILKTK